MSTDFQGAELGSDQISFHACYISIRQLLKSSWQTVILIATCLKQAHLCYKADLRHRYIQVLHADSDWVMCSLHSLLVNPWQFLR